MVHRRNTRKNDVSAFRALGREVEGLAGVLDDELKLVLKKALSTIWGKDPTGINQYEGHLPRPKEVLDMDYSGLQSAYGETLQFLKWRVGGSFEEPKPRFERRYIVGGNTWCGEGY